MDFGRRNLLALGAVAIPAAMSSMADATGRGSLLARYLRVWGSRDLAGIMDCVHPEIGFVGPNVQASGLRDYASSTKRFLALVDSVVVRASYDAEQGAMIAYDFVCRPPIGRAPTAELLAYRDGLIGRSEIFFDTRPFIAQPAPRPL